jgi:acetyl-CoA acetyltransferase
MAMRDVAIVGVHATEQARRISRSSLHVALEAAQGAVADAGLSLDDVDGLALEWPGPGGQAASPGDSSSWARFFGNVTYVARNRMDCAGIGGVAKAAAAVAAGLCDTIVVGGARTGIDSERRSLEEFSRPWGAWGVTVYALVAQRHMHEFGTTPEQLAKVASAIRNNGHGNPDAVMFGRGPYSVSDILASPMVAEPFHVLDLSLYAQGGAAVVITTADRARDLQRVPVRLLGATGQILQANYVNPPLYREVGQIGREATGRLLQYLGLSPQDIDVFCLYDPNSFEIIRQFEVLGLCEQGTGGAFVEDNSLQLDGNVPTNPDGGLLSFAWCGTHSMTLKVVECVKQLRSEAGNRQVPDANIAVATNAGAGSHHWEIGIFGR